MSSTLLSSPNLHHPPQHSPPPSSLLPSALPDRVSPDPPDDPASHELSHSRPESPPNFSPFFTLISNTASSTTHHPTVHYIFSDDTPDSDPITAAALQVLDPTSSASPPVIKTTDVESDGGSRGSARERYVLLDMDATGTNVISAQSMSRDWAVTSTDIASAPTWDDRGRDSEWNEGGLMLRIEGMEVPIPVEGSGERDNGDKKELEELMEIYEKRMGELRKVVDAGAGVGMIHQDQGRRNELVMHSDGVRSS